MDPLHPLITALHAQGRLRVWSLVITVFGDCVQYRGGRVSNVRLQTLLGRIGVEPGALRTALSRLNRDGWVTSDRKGRNSFYQLTPDGQARFTDATSRIYAPARVGPVQAWTVALGTDQPGLPIAPGVVLRPAEQAAPPPDCAVTGTLSHLTDQMRDRLLSAPHQDALRALFADIDALTTEPLSPLDSAAARILLIHRWRRIVLRYPDIPAQLMPRSLQGRDPRAEVAATYHRLTPATEIWLETPVQDIPGLPKAHPDFATRFTCAQSGT